MKDLSMHILDIIQNSIRAKANKIVLDIISTPAEGSYDISITDDGTGMDEKMMKRATDPFFTSRTTRKVGLGIPLLKHNAEHTGGIFSVVSFPGKGTKVKATFLTSHYDCLPEGDLAGTLSILVSANPEIDLILNYRSEKGEYHFSSSEVKTVLEDIPLNDPLVFPIIRNMLEENLGNLRTEFNASII